MDTPHRHSTTTTHTHTHHNTHTPEHTDTRQLTKIWPHRVITSPQRFTKRNFWIFPILKFENRSRTTCSRFLQAFALPDKAVQFQMSLGTQAARLVYSPFSPSITNDVNVSIATSLHQRLPFSGRVHHLSSPDTLCLTQTTFKITEYIHIQSTYKNTYTYSYTFTKIYFT